MNRRLCGERRPKQTFIIIEMEEMEMDEWRKMEIRNGLCHVMDGFMPVARESVHFQDFLSASHINFAGNEGVVANCPAGLRRCRLCSILMVPDEEDRVERFIGGLPDNIQGNVIAANPARLQDAIRIANQLMDKKVQGYAAMSAKNKRRMESNLRDNRG
ncbi:hypothetical protein Tco_1522997 [Tanacetum coccineum]